MKSVPSLFDGVSQRGTRLAAEGQTGAYERLPHTLDKYKESRQTQFDRFGARGLARGGKCHTWNNVTGIHGILILDEAETTHQLHLGDFSSAMSGKVVFNVGLGSCPQRVSWQASRGKKREDYGPFRGRFPK